MLTGTTKLEGDPKTIAKNCYWAAVIYAAFVGFCSLQVSVYSVQRYCRTGARRLVRRGVLGRRRLLQSSTTEQGRPSTAEAERLRLSCSMLQLHGIAEVELTHSLLLLTDRPQQPTREGRCTDLINALKGHCRTWRSLLECRDVQAILGEGADLEVG